MKLPTIVINAYNRPESIRRLLLSLDQAIIRKGAKLVFSLEYDPHPEVLSQVKEYIWNYGEKEILLKKQKQGLVGHFLYCGGLTKTLGDIIYLEDDLFVGRNFYIYAEKVLTTYENEESLAGFSLNALWFNGYLHLPFHPIHDGNYCFFLQVPWFQGQIYTRKQWHHFEQWYNRKNTVSEDLLIHDMFRNYKLQDDWFPIKTQYLIEHNKYYCFPRMAHCVNFGDVGIHFKKTTNFFQTELSVSRSIPDLLPFKECLAIYDSFYELLPSKLKDLVPQLNDLDVEVDLYGTKDITKVKSEYILTSRKPTQYIAKYALEMRPHELNIIYQIKGDHFYLAKKEEAKNDRDNKNRFYQKFNYYHRFKLSKLDLFKVLFMKLFRH